MACASLDRALVRRLHTRARADRWSLTIETFEAALLASAGRGLQNPGDQRQLQKYLDALHLEDLALACACAEGSDAAWDHVIREYRPVLYRAADAIDSTGGARDLADALYAELFGLSERDGVRRSHFRYYHGRSSLATWLRAVLAQRHIDRVRSQRRIESLPEEEMADSLPAPDTSIDPSRARYVDLMRRTIATAVAALAPRDRLRLTCYYAQNLTLAQIGRAMGEHEATVSRHLTRTRRDIRTTVERDLSERERMSEAQIDECFASVLGDAGSLDIGDLLGSAVEQTGSGRKEIGQDRSRYKERTRAGGT
jgi:RNA polymerase sigma-70 factor (ECF subfamily)